MRSSPARARRDLADGATHQGRTPAHWRRVALIVAKRTGHEVGLDTSTRMLAGRIDMAPVHLDETDVDEIKRLKGL